MDFKTIIPYLEESDEKLLSDFFDNEEIKSYLISKWDDYIESSSANNNENISMAEEITNKDDETLVPSVAGKEDRKKSFIDDFFFRTKLKEIENRLTKKHIQLPNGKVNQAYSAPFCMSDLGLNEISKIEFIGLENIGLKYNNETHTIEGTPTQPGDLKITLSCYMIVDDAEYYVFTKQIPIIINPDPRSLWNNIPTPEDIEYYKPDSDCKYIQVPKSKGFLGIGSIERKDLIAASQRGRSHGHEGKARDDDFSIVYNTESEWYLALVADGAGSATFARKGSEIACQTVSELCNEGLTNDKSIDILIKNFQKENSDENRKKLGDVLYNIIGAAVFKAYKNIEQEAADNDNQVKDYATTIIVAVTKKYKFGWFVASFWIGDGGIGLYNKEKNYIKIMGDPDGGEFAGQTRFLTMGEVMQPSEIYKRLRFEIIDDFTALILMTDGVTDPKFETDANLQKIEKWDSLWSDITSSVDLTDDNTEAAQQLLKWLDFWSPGNHDDRTIAMIY